MAEVAPAASSSPVVFFDGECPLCNRAVAYLAAKDTSGRLRFAHLQGAFADRTLDPALRDVGRDGTVVLLEPDAGNRVSVRSAAVLRALAHAVPGRSWLASVAARPGVIRVLDGLYGLIAHNRDRWFGREDACAVPDPSFRARFLG